MDHQDGAGQAGWPLGLETLNLRVHIMDAMRGGDIGSMRMSTPSFSSVSSSDFDTESSLSFFPDKSTTLGNLIGIRSNRRTRHASNSVHPEGKTKISRMGIIARTPSSGRATTWKSLTGCLPLTPRQNNAPLSLADLLKAEKRDEASAHLAARHEKLDTNASYGESDGILPDNTNSLLLGGHVDQSSSVDSKGLVALDLAMTEQTSSRLANMTNFQKWESSKILRRSYDHNTAQQRSLCMPCVSGILFKPNQSRGSPTGKSINHL